MHLKFLADEICDVSIKEVITLLTKLQIKNPSIIIENKNLQVATNQIVWKSLAKYLFQENQSIIVSEKLPKNIEHRSGLVFACKGFPNFLKDKETKIKHPWVILSNDDNIIQSQMDEPLYFYQNSSLYESFKIKNIVVKNLLAEIFQDKWKWNDKFDEDFLERRQNFQRENLIAMTANEPSWTILPNLDELKPSNLIPDAYEVICFYKSLFSSRSED